MTPEEGTTGAVRRILVVEDDPEMQHLLRTILAGEDREVVVAASAAEATEALEAGEVAMVFLDLLLPDADGRTLLGRIRGRPSTGGVPVVVASSRSGAEVRAECFALGADAFWEKPFDPEAVAEDVAARLEWGGERRGDLTDDLTGFLNRAGILQRLGEDGEGDAGGPPGWVLVLELDGLRQLSDRYGWGTAERFAWEVGRAMERVLPEEASVGRLGGGEFVVAVWDDQEGARALAEKLLEAARRRSLEGPDGETFRVTLSAAVVPRRGDMDPDAVLAEGERLLYQAQKEGGNRVRAAGDDAAEDDGGVGPVLVAEDDDITAKILTHRLEKEGLDVRRFPDGATAYRGALEMTPSLVILDVKMPGMDGFEVLERLRKTPAYAEVPIVMLTSMGSEGDVVRAFELGADDYVLKPFSPAELLARVRRLTSRGRAET